jgi:hypothetical protein
MKIDGEHYVVVTERDLSEAGMNRTGSQGGGPLVWETYLGKGSTKEAAEARAESLRGTFGKARVARLVFDVKEG